jgi:hypothetical protein
VEFPDRQQDVPATNARRLPWVWDYEIDEEQFRSMLGGERTMGRLDQRWAAVRLIEYASYADIVRLLGFRLLIEGWPRWRSHVRSVSRRRGIDFLVDWLPKHHPELLQ